MTGLLERFFGSREVRREMEAMRIELGLPPSRRKQRKILRELRDRDEQNPDFDLDFDLIE